EGTCLFTVIINDVEEPFLAGVDDCTSLNETDVNECLADAQNWDAESESLLLDIAALYDDNCTDPLNVTLETTTAGLGNTDCSWTFTYEYNIADSTGNFVTCEVVRSGGSESLPDGSTPNI